MGRGCRSWAGACLLAALGGCQAVQDWRNEVDPIRGGPPIPSASATTGRPPASTGEVPPLLTGRPSTSPAALTAGPAGAEAPVAAPTAPAVTIQGPVAAGQAPVATPGVIVPTSATVTPPAPAGDAGVRTFEQVQQALAARGVTEQHLDTTGKPDEWSFTCAIPNPGNPLLLSHYETKRVGRGGLEAMIAVLEDIDRAR